uniref:hypothetical protein n=1 Tax=Serratia proteamaculans TaxID=28151 RepID=UPI001F4C4605|nr:hypothetical protein [Serratia proteamaculans]
MGNNFRSFRFLLPQQRHIGDLFPWRQASEAVKILPIGTIALRENFKVSRGITLQIFHSTPVKYICITQSVHGRMNEVRTVERKRLCWGQFGYRKLLYGKPAF